MERDPLACDLVAERRWHVKRAEELRQQASNAGTARILAESHERVAARLAARLEKGGAPVSRAERTDEEEH